MKEKIQEKLKNYQKELQESQNQIQQVEEVRSRLFTRIVQLNALVNELQTLIKEEEKQSEEKK